MHACTCNNREIEPAHQTQSADVCTDASYSRDVWLKDLIRFGTFLRTHPDHVIHVLVWKFVALYVMGEAAHEFAMDAAGADAPALAAATEAAAPTAEGGVVAPTAGGDVGTEITFVVREGRGAPLFTVKTPTSRKLDEVVEEKL